MSTQQENTDRGISTFVRAFMRLPLKQRFAKAVSFIRGLRVALRCDTRGLVDAGKRIKILKQNGEIHLDRYCRIYDDVHFAVVGDSPAQKAILRIGVDSGIAARTKINVTDSVTIGARCSIGWDCDIMDSSFHRVNFPDRPGGSLTGPVVIEDDVWIGVHCIILKGVTIGANSVIGAGSVVIKDIPPNSFAAGSPAKVIREIAGWDRNPHKVIAGEAK